MGAGEATGADERPPSAHRPATTARRRTVRPSRWRDLSGIAIIVTALVCVGLYSVHEARFDATLAAPAVDRQYVATLAKATCLRTVAREVVPRGAKVYDTGRTRQTQRTIVEAITLWAVPTPKATADWTLSLVRGRSAGITIHTVRRR